MTRKIVKRSTFLYFVISINPVMLSMKCYFKMLNSGHFRLCSFKPIIQLIVPYSGFVSRPILNILDAQGNPINTEPDVPSEKRAEILEQRDRKRFSQKAYSEYMKQMSLKDIKQCKFDNRITYVPINYNHPDFTRAKLIVRGIIPDKKQYVALEGRIIIRDALSCGLKLDKLFFTREDLLQSIPEIDSLLVAANQGQFKDRGPILMKITPRMMESLSKVQTPPGLLAFFEKPTVDTESSATRSCCLPVKVIADNIRDPGNMGTLIRSCAAVGVESLICSKGCVNPWESKVVRSGVGAHFRVNIITDFVWSNLPSILPPHNSFLIFAQKTGIKRDKSDFKSAQTIDDKNYFDINYSSFVKDDKKLCIVIGGETEGISDEALDASRIYKACKASIPIMKGIDSLNSAIAGSIILFELQRQIINVIACETKVTE